MSEPSFGFWLVCAAFAVVAGLVYLGMIEDCASRGGVMVKGLGDFPVCVSTPQKVTP
jgi:hypothetical protein